ncbi:hypothetical protein SNE40_004004 [Patella caerulea]|uniref:Sulfotransferase domain-containing protein n=1 Tax=Patella caerulea TaxID=87958 RepID=A0AAN8KFF8_PATCE
MTDQNAEEGKPIVIKDKSGNELTAYELDGIPLPIFPESFIGNSTPAHLKKVREMTIRDDDVIICAYPKAGTHWIWEVVQMLTSQNTEYHKDIKEKQMIEAAKIESIDSEPSPRVLNSHLWPQHLPKQMFEKKTKIIFVNRNPKDILISLFWHYTGAEKEIGYLGNLSDFIDLFLNKRLLYGLWYEYTLEWERFLKTTENPFFELSYEDMQQNSLHHVRELAKFLGRHVTDELGSAIVDACSFDKLKKANDEVKDDFLKPLFKEGLSIFRKGKVGDWKNWLTVAESENIDRVTAERMKDSQVQLKYTIEK